VCRFPHRCISEPHPPPPFGEVETRGDHETFVVVRPLLNVPLNWCLSSVLKERTSFSCQFGRRECGHARISQRRRRRNLYTREISHRQGPGYLSYAARQGKGKGCSSGTSSPSSFGIWTARSEVSVGKALDSVRESGSSPLRPELHLAPFPPALPRPVPAEIDHVPIPLLSRHIHAEARCSLNYYVRDPLVRDGETPRDGIVLREHQ
jgi:hypothetical protein